MLPLIILRHQPCQFCILCLAAMNYVLIATQLDTIFCEFKFGALCGYLPVPPESTTPVSIVVECVDFQVHGSINTFS